MGRAERLLIEPLSTPVAIVDLISDDLSRVEIAFREQLASPVRIVDEIGGYVAASGGKRVRPTLHLLCARMCGYEGPHQVALATVLEFIHSATLIHDDILDEAETRRGGATVNRRWGNNVSVLFGDYLFAKAMEMALQAESLQVMKKLADVTLRMTEGEMLQTRYVGRLDLTTEEYLDLVERKTAALFGCCCELAGILAGMDAARLDSLRRYGTHLGMAFQLVDDLLDFTGEAERMGKPVASDLCEGKATLAVLDLLSQGKPEVRDIAQRIVDGLPAEAPEFARFSGWLQESGAIERTHERAREYASSALQELSHFPDSPAKQALTALPDLLLFRDH